MGFNNLFDLLNKFSQFQTMLKSTNQDPRQLLQNECNKRNITGDQLNELIKQAKQLGNLLGVK